MLYIIAHMFWRFIYSRQLRSVFLWLSGVVSNNDLIVIKENNRVDFFRFSFPLRYGDWPHRVHNGREEEATFFIFTDESVITTPSSAIDWIKFFSSPRLQVFEKKSRVSSAPPLRWGLNNDEKKLCFKIAREALIKFLENAERLDRSYFSALPSRLFFKTDLDVALWVNGRLRGSAVVENYNLSEGIAEAAILASRDARFKPLAYDELPFTRIEVTVMHDLRVPFSPRERRQNAIYPEKGYLLKKDKHVGWFLPEIHNVRRYRDLESFLGDLAQEKAGLPRAASSDAEVFIFEVDDFIESEDHERTLKLMGPIIPIEEEITPKFIMQRLRMAADWLCRIQELDGNISPITNPLTGHQTQIDWPRLAFTAWALAEFGKVTKEKKYIGAAEKSFEYLKKFFIPNSPFLIPSYELTLAYFGQLAFCLGKSNDATATANRILGRLNTLNFESITFAQIASFFKILPQKDRRIKSTLENLSTALKENFERGLKKGTAMNLAVWVELVNTFQGIDNEFSEKIADWLKNQQLPSGAFPESTHSDFVYTRGTGKIFEVLALSSQANKEVIAKTLHWLLSMQYDEENMFFISKVIRPKILGAFRHDYFNQEAWIDAAGHILLGGARLLIAGRLLPTMNT